VEPTAEFAQLQLGFVDQIQRRYEVIRPLVLFGDRTAVQRAGETQTHPDTVRKLQRRFRQQGMLGQPSPRHPLLWWGINSTLLGKYPLDQHPEPQGPSSRALNACESTRVNPIRYGGPTRSASFPTEVNEVLTWFGNSMHHVQREFISEVGDVGVGGVLSGWRNHPHARQRRWAAVTTHRGPLSSTW
jgi:hypothetical protein